MNVCHIALPFLNLGFISISGGGAGGRFVKLFWCAKCYKDLMNATDKTIEDSRKNQVKNMFISFYVFQNNKGNYDLK